MRTNMEFLLLKCFNKMYILSIVQVLTLQNVLQEYPICQCCIHQIQSTIAFYRQSFVLYDMWKSCFTTSHKLLTRWGTSVTKVGILYMWEWKYWNFALKNFILLLNSFITSVLEYKTSLNLNFKCVCVAVCFLVMNLYSREFLYNSSS